MHKILPIAVFLLMLAGTATCQAPESGAHGQKSAGSAEALVDINHAGIDELLQVPGMTRSWAQRIIRYRPYRTKLDLVQDGVMPLDVYQRIREHIIAHQDKKQ